MRDGSIELCDSLELVTNSRGEGRELPVRMSEDQYARLERVAAMSGVTAARWLDSVLAAAMASDEQEWREAQDLRQMMAEVDRDDLIAGLSQDLRPSVVERLVERVAAARQQGRAEGRRFAAQLGIGRTA